MNSFENHKKILVVGKTGHGKSQFCKKITQKEFKVSSSFLSMTKIIQSEVIDFEHNNNKFELQFIDTPGLFDSSGKKQDDHFIKDFQDFLINLMSINIVILCIKSDERFSSDHVSALQVYIDLFGNDLFDHMIILLTKWPMDQRSQNQRLKTGNTEDKRISELLSIFNDKYKKIPCKIILIDSDPYDVEDEIIILNNKIKEICEIIVLSDKFYSLTYKNQMDEIKKQKDFSKRHTEYSKRIIQKWGTNNINNSTDVQYDWELNNNQLWFTNKQAQLISSFLRMTFTLGIGGYDQTELRLSIVGLDFKDLKNLQRKKYKIYEIIIYLQEHEYKIIELKEDRRTYKTGYRSIGLYLREIVVQKINTEELIKKEVKLELIQ
jgi:GTPase SAR1 family protein